MVFPVKFGKTTLSPTLTLTGKVFPSLFIIPGPHASTSPLFNASCAFSGIKMPDLVFSCGLILCTKIRSNNGTIFLAAVEATLIISRSITSIRCCIPIPLETSMSNETKLYKKEGDETIR
eukprot:NODE_789_length_3873_cov_0.228405.p6 type:complete len:120 gc:universal NODE_789_length_3873_cov_0.228405:1029-1388(+)